MRRRFCGVSGFVVDLVDAWRCSAHFLILLNFCTMEEKKRLTVTIAVTAKFREEHLLFNDDYLASSVESIYPNLSLVSH